MSLKLPFFLKEWNWCMGYMRTQCWLECLNRKWRKLQEAGEICLSVIYNFYALHRMLLRRSDQRGWGGQGMHCQWERWERHTQFYSENMKGWDDLEDLDFVWRIILKWILKKWDVRFWIDLSRNLVDTIITLQVTYKADNFWVTEIRLLSQEWIPSVSKLVI
jgi:hypothetical protein